MVSDALATIIFRRLSFLEIAPTLKLCSQLAFSTAVEYYSQILVHTKLSQLSYTSLERKSVICLVAFVHIPNDEHQVLYS